MKFPLLLFVLSASSVFIDLAFKPLTNAPLISLQTIQSDLNNDLHKHGKWMYLGCFIMRAYPSLCVMFKCGRGCLGLS